MSRVFIGQFKGAKGDKGDTGNKGDRGETGAAGERGSKITRGTAITGTNTNGTKFPNSGITDAKVHDYYINTDTGNLYECTVSGAANVAEWVHAGSFKGPKGDTGPAGSISAISDQKPIFDEADKLENIMSGETVKIAFGKLKKALSILITHYTQQATASLLGHVKLSNSAAVTQTGQMALDAIEKNASIAGTLANQIAQQNSNLAGIFNTSAYSHIKFLGMVYYSDQQLKTMSKIFTANKHTLYAFINDDNGSSLIIGYCYGGANQDRYGAQMKLTFSKTNPLQVRSLNYGEWSDWFSIQR